MILGWEYITYYTPDSHIYIAIAKELPSLKTTIFPLFYPLLLKSAYLIFHDYDVGAKFLNISLIIFILTFVKHKGFYWKEIWMLFTFSSLQSIYTMIWSENVILVLIILYSYYNYKFLKNEINPNLFLNVSCLLLLFMFATKYTSVFFLVANFIFAMYLVFKRKNDKATSYFLSTVISLILFSLYLVFNYILGGSFAGRRGIPTSFNYTEYFFSSLKNIPLSYDPFAIAIQKISIKIKLLYDLPYITIVPYFISYLVTAIVIMKFRKLRNKKIDSITIFYIITSLVFLLFTFISSYFTKIDIIDSRLLINFYLFLIVSVIYFMNENKIFIKDKYFLYGGVLSLIIYLVNLLIVKFLYR